MLGPTVGYGVPCPVGAAEHRRTGSEKREDCLSDRRERVPQRRFRAEKHRAPGASAEGKSSGALSFAHFSLGKQRKVGRVRAAARFQKGLPRSGIDAGFIALRQSMPSLGKPTRRASRTIPAMPVWQKLIPTREQGRGPAASPSRHRERSPI